jgi:hypothetical protein
VTPRCTDPGQRLAGGGYQRAVIEPRIGWLKERRRIDTRFEKLAVHFLGVLNFAVLQLYLRAGFANTA